METPKTPKRGRPNKAVTKPAPDPKDQRVILQTIVADQSLDPALRLAAAKELASLQTKPEPEPRSAEQTARIEAILRDMKPESASKPSRSMAEMRHWELSRQLRVAAARSDEDMVKRVLKVFKAEGLVPPPFQLAPRPAPTLTERVTTAEKQLQEQRDDAHARLMREMNEQALHPQQTAGSRQHIPQHVGHGYYGDEWS